jgi:hypothetical protein
MSNKKISQLSAATTPLAGTETLPIVQSGATVNVSVSNLTAGRSVGLGSNSSVVSPYTYGGANYGLAITSSGNATGYLNNLLGSPQLSLGGYYYGSGSYYATSTSYSSIDLGAGTIDFYGNTGLTSGNTFTRTHYAGFDTSGNFVPAIASNGINFTANTPASGMTSQLLNWYEEGAYTPTVTAQIGSITSYTASAKYTRIGRQVTIEAIITLTNAGTGLGELHFTLPFTPVSDGNGSGFENGNTGFQLSVFASATSTYASVRKYDSTTIIATNNIIRAGVTYFM